MELVNELQNANLHTLLVFRILTPFPAPSHAVDTLIKTVNYHKSIRQLVQVVMTPSGIISLDLRLTGRFMF